MGSFTLGKLDTIYEESPRGAASGFRSCLFFGDFSCLSWVSITVTILYFILYDLLPIWSKLLFLSILLHKYLILCVFTSYSREIIIRKKFWSHPAAKWIGCWLFLLLLSILMAACLRHVTYKRMSTSWDTIW